MKIADLSLTPLFTGCPHRLLLSSALSGALLFTQWADQLTDNLDLLLR